jgi:hypothetical protein
LEVDDKRTVVAVSDALFERLDEGDALLLELRDADTVEVSLEVTLVDSEALAEAERDALLLGDGEVEVV